MTKRYNVVIMPNQSVSSQAKRVSELISRERTTSFVLDDTTHIPHFSLYHFSAEEVLIPKIIEELEEIARTCTSFFLQSRGYELLDGQWLMMMYEQNEALLHLHERTLEGIAPLRAPGYIQTEEWSDMSLARKENLERYGWSEARSLYQPHITLTRLESATSRELLLALPQDDFAFQAEKIALYELGQYGTCHTLLAEYLLTMHNL